MNIRLLFLRKYDHFGKRSPIRVKVMNNGIYELLL